MASFAPGPPTSRDVGLDFEALLEWAIRSAVEDHQERAAALADTARELYLSTRFCPQFHALATSAVHQAELAAFDELANGALRAALVGKFDRAAELAQRLRELFAIPGCKECGARRWRTTALSVSLPLHTSKPAPTHR